MNKQLEPFCFWCGGNARWDFASEPRPFYENVAVFCESCASMRGEDGILLFEMTETNPGCGNPTLPGRAVYYTGRWVVVDRQMVAMIYPPEGAATVIATGYGCLRYDNYAKVNFDKYPWRTIQ